MPVSVEYVTQGLYANVIEQGRELLHAPSGHPMNRLFKYHENDYHLAILPASKTTQKDWKKGKKNRSSFFKQIDFDSHKAAMIRLYYRVSNHIGLGSIASPFEYQYNDQMRLMEPVVNPQHTLFLQEESLVVGGFVRNGERPEVQPPHPKQTFHHRDSVIPAGQDAGSCHQHGFTIIMPLLEAEPKTMYYGKWGHELVIPYNKAMVVCGNFHCGGVIQQIREGDRSVWPALFVHWDMTTRKRKSSPIGNVRYSLWANKENAHKENKDVESVNDVEVDSGGDSGSIYTGSTISSEGKIQILAKTAKATKKVSAKRKLEDHSNNDKTKIPKKSTSFSKEATDITVMSNNAQYGGNTGVAIAKSVAKKDKKDKKDKKKKKKNKKVWKV